MVDHLSGSLTQSGGLEDYENYSYWAWKHPLHCRLMQMHVRNDDVGICLADPNFRALDLAASLPCSFSAMVRVICACFRPRDQVYGTTGGDECNGARLELPQIPNGNEPGFHGILA